MKIPEYIIQDNEIKNFTDKVREVWNYGKYQVPIVTALPNWVARPGESVLFRPSSGGTTEYYYLDSAWVSTWSIII